MDTQHILEHNKNILDKLKTYQDEINYKIVDKLDYSKKIQKILLDRTVFDKKIFSSDKLVPLCLKRVDSNVILDKDASHILSQLKTIDFQIVRSIIQMIFDRLTKNRKNYSSFMKKIKAFFDDEASTSWDEVESRHGENVVFYLLFLFVQSTNDVMMFMSEKPVDDMKGATLIHKRRVHLMRDGLFNFWQLLNYENQITTAVPFVGDEPKCEYEFYVYLVFDPRVRKAAMNGFRIIDVVSGFKLLFHPPTVLFLNERKHDVIYNHLYVYLLTFEAFLQRNVAHSMNYLLAGSVIKSAYNVRDCADVDFLVLDHEGQINDFYPEVGVSGIFEDFGKTYYGNEEYYFPMIPEMYEKQKKMKDAMREEPSKIDEPLTILNNFPKYSVSGLKAGRYIDIFSGECKRIGYSVGNMDDLVFNPENRIYFLGCPVIQLKLEMIRDNIKDIDLGRISRKQLHDLHFLKKNYEFLFTQTECREFGFDRFSSGDIRRPKIVLSLNCYNRPLISDTKVGYDLVIRRIPLYLQDITRTMIEQAPLLISLGNDVKEFDFKRIYQSPLLSSLPSSMKREGTTTEVSYYYEVSSVGEIKIYINPSDEVSLFRDVCITGHIRIENGETRETKKILISVDGAKMKRIYGQIGNIDIRKEYRMRLIIFMKNMIQIHKMVDCHTKEKVLVDFLR